MASARHASRGLWYRVTKAALAVGAVTVAAAIFIALSSQSRINAMNTRSTDTLVIQTVEQRIQGRLGTVSNMIDHAGADSPRSKADLLERLGVLFDSSPTHFDALVVCDIDGKVEAGVPPGATGGRTARSLTAYSRAAEGRTGFITVKPGAGRWELWYVRTTIDRSGQPLYILARLDTSFLDETLDSVAKGSPGRTVVVLDGFDVLIGNSAGKALELRHAQWKAGSGYVHEVSLRTVDGQRLAGHFRDIGMLEGLAWRIVVVQPPAAMFYDNARLALPLVGILTAGGAVALLIAWSISLGTVRPLRELERAARAAASGALVRPLSVDRDDEIGQVSQAFNAVALRLNALHDLSQLLASTTQLDQVLDGILGAVGHLVGDGAVSVYLIQDEGRFVPVRTRGKAMAALSPIDGGASAWFDESIASRQPTKFTGSAEDLESQLPGYENGGLTAWSMPLFAQGGALGMVVVARSAAKPFTEAEIEMLRTFSAQASVAVHNSMLFEHESEARRVAEALRRVAELLVRPQRLGEALDAVEAIVGDLLSAAEVRIVLTNPSSVGMELSQRPGDAELLALGLERLSETASEAAVVRLGDSVQADAVLERSGALTCRLVPVSAETDHPAIMAAFLGRRELTGREVDAAQAIADEVSLALDNAYFYQRALTRADNLQTIFDISQAVGSPLNLNVVLNRVLEVVQKILSADALALLSYDSVRRTLRMSMGRGTVPKEFTELELKPGEDIPGAVFSKGEPVSLKNMRPSSGGVAAMASQAGLHSMLAVPLVARGRSIGVLMALVAHEGGFVDEDVSLLHTFAFQAALAIDTARLYSREHEVADVLQASILPEELPQLPEIESASVYAPAGEDIDIGGDYYDVFRTGDSGIWIAIGDVCGKGIHAATKTSMIKYVVRALASAGLDPSEIVSHANDMAASTGEASDIMTLWVGRYDPSKSMLTWANGGHPPALIRAEKGSIEELEPTGPLLGALAGARYGQVESNLSKGSTLLLYTDGVSEARSGNIFFGTDRIKRVLGQLGAPAEISRRLLAAVRDHVKGELRDDIAVLVIAPKGSQGYGVRWKEEA